MSASYERSGLPLISRAQRIKSQQRNVTAPRAAEPIAQRIAGLGGRATQRRLGDSASKTIPGKQGRLSGMVS